MQTSVIWKLLLHVHKKALNWIFLSYWCLKKQNAHTKVKYDYLQMFSEQLYYKWKIWSNWVHTTVLLHLCVFIFLKCICMVQALTFKVIFDKIDLTLLSCPFYSQNSTDARKFYIWFKYIILGLDFKYASVHFVAEYVIACFNKRSICHCACHEGT